jgi:nitrogen regulatory protein P-II 1
MEKIEAIIQPAKLEDVKAALVKAGVSGLTVSHVEGFGRQKGKSLSYRGTHYTASFVPKVRITTVVPSNRTDDIVEAILKAARTGAIGDGKIFVTPVSRVIRIRTNEQNEAALEVGEPALV